MYIRPNGSHTNVELDLVVIYLMAQNDDSHLCGVAGTKKGGEGTGGEDR